MGRPQGAHDREGHTSFLVPVALLDISHNRIHVQAVIISINGNNPFKSVSFENAKLVIKTLTIIVNGYAYRFIYKTLHDVLVCSVTFKSSSK